MVYQAEIYAILQALEWIQTQTDSDLYIIYSCLCSLRALKSRRTKHLLVLSIKQIILILKYNAQIGT